MLSKIEIAHFRSCEKTEFALQPDLTVLIGPNGAGKTNVLSALMLLHKLAKQRPGFLRDQSGEATHECSLKATFDQDDGAVTLRTGLQLSTDDQNREAILGSSQAWTSQSYLSTRKAVQMPMWYSALKRSLATLDPNSNAASSARHYTRVAASQAPSIEYLTPKMMEEVASIAAMLESMKYYGASQFTNPGSCPVSLEVEQESQFRRTVDTRGHRQFLADLYAAWSSKVKTNFDRFLSIVGPQGIGLVDVIGFEELQTSSIEYSVRSGGKVHKRTRKKLLVVPQFRIGKNTLSPNQLSEGTFRTLTLLFFLVTDESSFLLIEEPDVCVHQGLLSSIMELIKVHSMHKQILISTHSDFVLDQVEPRNILRVTKERRVGTQVSSLKRSMSSKSYAALKKYLQTQGTLGEFWKHGGFD